MEDHRPWGLAAESAELLGDLRVLPESGSPADCAVKTSGSRTSIEFTRWGRIRGTADVLVRRNGVQDVPDVGEVNAPVVSAEVVATPIIRRVADRESRIETLIGAGREKHVIDVLVSSLVAGRGNGVYHGKHVVI